MPWHPLAHLRPSRPARSRRFAALVALGALGVVTAACGDDDGAGSGGEGDLSISGGLASLPAGDGGSGGPVLVVYGDLAAAADLAGVDRPDAADTAELTAYVSAVTGTRDRPASAAAALPEQFGRAVPRDDEVADELGFSLAAIDAVIERSTMPGRVTVIEGDIDPGAVEEALDDAGDGVLVAGDPDVAQDLDDVTAARPLGGPLWVALDGDTVVTAASEDDVRAAVDADGGDDTLAGDPALAGLAAAFDDRDAYSAMLLAGDDIGGLDALAGERPLTPEQRAALEDEVEPCTDLTGAAAGVADDGDPVILLGVASASDESAEENEAILGRALAEGTDMRSGRPWSDLLEVESIDTGGTVTVVTTRPTSDMPLQGWTNLVSTRSFPPC